MTFRLFSPMLMLMPQMVLASGVGQSCDSAALRAAEAYGVPPQIMLAITRVESGKPQGDALQPWPWAINLQGEGHWFDTADDAAAFAQNAVDSGVTNLDIGCFKLNWRWHGDKFSSIDEMFDPTNNADHAARFLVENHQRTGNWIDAVAAYHSASPDLAEIYIQKIEGVLQEFADAGQLPDQPPEKPIRVAVNTYPLLMPGVSGGLASLVPTQSGGQPLFLAGP